MCISVLGILIYLLIFIFKLEKNYKRQVSVRIHIKNYEI